MKTLDFCRLMKGIEARPTDKVQLTVGQWLGLRQHVLGCLDCRARMNNVLAADDSPPRIGPAKEAN